MSSRSETAPALERRRHCPACSCTSGSTIYDLPFDQEPMSSYLREFYRGALDTKPLVGSRYELVRCTRCGLVYQRLAPNDVYLEQMYDGAAFAHERAVSAARGLRVRQMYSQDVELAIAAFGPDPSQVAVLDHGAGTGLWLQMAAAYGCRTAGSEISESGRRRLVDRGHDAHHPEQLPAERFDYINSEQVLEHLVSPATALAALVAALRPGGVVRLSVPNGGDIESRLTLGDWSASKSSSASLNAVAPLEHLNCFDHRSLRHLALASGLEPFRYPLRIYVSPMTRIRALLGAVRQRASPPSGTLLLFRKPLR